MYDCLKTTNLILLPNTHLPYSNTATILRFEVSIRSTSTSDHTVVACLVDSFERLKKPARLTKAESREGSALAEVITSGDHCAPDAAVRSGFYHGFATRFARTCLLLRIMYE